MTERQNLIALYGQCKTCGAARTVRQSSDDTGAVELRTVCTKDESHDS